MQVYVLDAEYNLVGMIEEAESVLWNKKYNDVGESELYLPCNEEYLDLLKKGNYLFRYDDDMVCKIEKREIETDVENGDYIIIPATDICNILAGRIVRWQIVYSGSVAGFIEKVLTDNVINPAQTVRAIPNFEFVLDTSNGAFTETIEVSTFTEDLLQLIISTCKSYNYGFRLSLDINTHTLVFRLYKGKNKALLTSDEHVEFSPQFANILASHYVEDDSNSKNVAYVSYKSDEDESVHLLSVYKGMDEGLGEPSGEARKEIFVDGTNVSRDITKEELEQLYPDVELETVTHTATVGPYAGKEVTNYYIPISATNPSVTIVATSTVEVEDEVEKEKIVASDTTYIRLVRNLGITTLAEHSKTTEFSGDVDTQDTYEYKKDYDLGDIVLVENEYGIKAEARITEGLESDDNEDGYTVEPTFEYLN